MYLSFRPSSDNHDEMLAYEMMEKAEVEIRHWMLLNKLKLNDEKTEFMIIGKQGQCRKLSKNDVTIGEVKIESNVCTRNLGVMFDAELNMNNHVNLICKNAFYHLRNIAHIRNYLDMESTVTLVHAFISSRIDYCNSLLYGITKYNLEKLQKVQNAAARVVSGKRKHDHISSTLFSLHWLPVKYRIEFKLLLLTYKALHGMAPDYIKDLLTLHVNTRDNMRSSDNCMPLFVPRSRLVTAGDVCFSIAAPKMWNALPNSIRSAKSLDVFKMLLKTHLFKHAFRK